MDAQQALERLIQGNTRFATGNSKFDAAGLSRQRSSLVDGQTPFAIILGCSDSRVPAEIVFDQGLGDLFVIRVAGNIVAPSQIGSVEFAAEQFGAPLVVLLGHTNCGAVEATLNHLTRKVDSGSKNIDFIVNRIRPAVAPLVQSIHQQDDFTTSNKDQEALYQQLSQLAVRANIQASVNQLRHGSDLLENRIANGLLRVVGAEYSLVSGKVEFFCHDELPS